MDSSWPDKMPRLADSPFCTQKTPSYFDDSTPALFFSPSFRSQAVYGDGYLYVIDLAGRNIANIISGRSRMRAAEE